MKYAVLIIVAVGSLSRAAAIKSVGHESLHLSRTGSPVERVVNLLKDLQARVTSDQRKEGYMYEKYSCWCEKTTARKAKAIEDAKKDLTRLGTEIQTLRGDIATIITEVETLMADIKKNEKDQVDATTIRQTENEEYMAENGEMKGAMQALQAAITMLGDATFSKPGALLQKGATQAEVTTRVKEAVAALPMRVFETLAGEKLALLRAYAEGKSSIRGTTNYKPASQTIQGILQGMYDTFTTDLEDMDEAEGTKNKDFEDLMATLHEKLTVMHESVVKKEEDKAEKEVTLAETTQEYDDTEAQMNADIEFFDTTKEACTDNADIWSKRETVRKEELEAIEKAIEILHSDDARELFDKSIKAGVETGFKEKTNYKDYKADPYMFLQMDQVEWESAENAPAKKAYDALRAQAKLTQSLRLAKLAAQVRLAKKGHFDAVIADIEKLITDLQTEETDDKAKRDQCKDEYSSIKGVIADVEWKIEVNDRNIQELTDTIEKKEKELEQTEEEILKTKEDIQKMIDQRKEENDDFEAAKKDDEDAIVLLEDAKKVLEDFYSKNDIDLRTVQGGEGVDLIQSWYVGHAPFMTGPEKEFAVSNDTAPEFKISDKGHRKVEGKGIVAMLEMISQDLSDEITNSVAAEAAALARFEKTKAAAEKYELELGTKKTNLETTIADKKKDKSDEEADKTKNEKALADEKDYKKKITPDCDFVIQKFEERLKAREAEMQGLMDAKAFLVGYRKAHMGGATKGTPN